MSRIDSYRAAEWRLVAGVMSGTSLDGIDVAFLRLAGSGLDLRHELLGFRTLPFPAGIKERLLDASAGTLPMRESFELHADLGAIYADAIAAAAADLAITLSRLDAVGLHGQTVYHVPRRQPNGVTVQLGCGAVVAERLGTIVVNDFRSADLAVGGEGAPLVPYCDLVLLGSDSNNRVALNIGGIANITWLPAGATLDTLIAFDTGPGNMLIDAAMRELRGMDYDEGGTIAAQGHPDGDWLDELLRDEYYAWAPPKSAGRERFGEDAGRSLAQTARARAMRDEDIIATLTLLTARSIARAIREFASRGEKVDEIIVGGGGARNRTMIRMLEDEFPGAKVLEADAFGLPADAKEAICFAILANEALLEVPANVPSVTGARRPVVSGAIRLP